MKPAGILAVLAGLAVGALLALIPTSVSVLGFSASCGPSALRIFATKEDSDYEFGQALVDQCVQQSWVRLVAGGVVGGGVAIAGVVMLSVAPKARPVWQAWTQQHYPYAQQPQHPHQSWASPQAPPGRWPPQGPPSPGEPGPSGPSPTGQGSPPRTELTPTGRLPGGRGGGDPPDEADPVEVPSFPS